MDGQEVVDLLNEPGALAEVEETVPEDALPEELETTTEDMGESDPSTFVHQSQNSSMVEMLYGGNGTLSTTASPLKLGS